MPTPGSRGPLLACHSQQNPLSQNQLAYSVPVSMKQRLVGGKHSVLQTHDYMNASVLAFISREIMRLIGNQITLPSLFTPPPSSTVSFLSKSLISPFYPDSDALVFSLFKRMPTSSFNPKPHLCQAFCFLPACWGHSVYPQQALVLCS